MSRWSTIPASLHYGLYEDSTHIWPWPCRHRWCRSEVERGVPLSLTIRYFLWSHSRVRLRPIWHHFQTVTPRDRVTSYWLIRSKVQCFTVPFYGATHGLTIAPYITLVCVSAKQDTFQGHPLNWRLEMTNIMKKSQRHSVAILVEELRWIL